MSAMARSYQTHFEAFCRGNLMSLSGIVYAKSNKTSKIREKRRPDQKLPNKVWEKVEKDISIEFFEGQDLSSRRRQLRTNLTNFLKDVSTGTADGENGEKPELQHVDIIPLIKSSDVYASHKMAENGFKQFKKFKLPKKEKYKTRKKRHVARLRK